MNTIENQNINSQETVEGKNISQKEKIVKSDNLKKYARAIVLSLLTFFNYNTVSNASEKKTEQIGGEIVKIEAIVKANPDKVSDISVNGIKGKQYNKIFENGNNAYEVESSDIQGFILKNTKADKESGKITVYFSDGINPKDNKPDGKIDSMLFMEGEVNSENKEKVENELFYSQASLQAITHRSSAKREFSEGSSGGKKNESINNPAYDNRMIWRIDYDKKQVFLSNMGTGESSVVNTDAIEFEKDADKLQNIFNSSLEELNEIIQDAE